MFWNSTSVVISGAMPLLRLKKNIPPNSGGINFKTKFSAPEKSAASKP